MGLLAPKVSCFGGHCSDPHARSVTLPGRYLAPGRGLLEAIVLTLGGALIPSRVARALLDGKLQAFFNAVFTPSVSTQLIAVVA
jgi:hypothetical protein